MIPNVSINWCNRTAQCSWCEHQIEAGTPMVSVFFWNKGTDEGKNKRGWNYKFYYHPDCWVLQGLDYLKMNPYVPYKRKKGKTLTTEEKKERYVILHAKSSLEQRRGKLKADNPDRVLLEAHIDTLTAELMVKIVPLGGIPPKWLE